MHKENADKAGRKLAVYFPGIGYHCDKPLLYYSRRLAAAAGYEELQLSYTFSGGNIRGNKEKMREAFFALYEQAKEQLGAVDWSACDEILFVSKSIGTIISAAYAAEQKISCRQILYTPLEDTFRVEEELGLSDVCQAEAGLLAGTTVTQGQTSDYKQMMMQKTGKEDQTEESAWMIGRAIAFIGTADPWSEVPRVIALSEKKGIPIFSYESANHSLETGDALECLEILTDVMTKTKAFLCKKELGSKT